MEKHKSGHLPGMGTHRHTYLWVMGALLVGAAALLHWVHFFGASSLY